MFALPVYFWKCVWATECFIFALKTQLAFLHIALHRFPYSDPQHLPIGCHSTPRGIAATISWRLSHLTSTQRVWALKPLSTPIGNFLLAFLQHTHTFSWRLPPLDLYIYAGLYFLILSSLMWGSLFPPTWRSAIDIPALWNFACNCWDDHMSYGFCKSILTRKMELLPHKVSIHKHDLLALGQNCWCLFCHHWSHQRNEEQATNLYQRGRDFLRAHKRLTDISQRTGFELILSSTLGPKPG